MKKDGVQVREEEEGEEGSKEAGRKARREGGWKERRWGSDSLQSCHTHQQQ